MIFASDLRIRPRRTDPDGNSRNGTRARTASSEVGPMAIDVPQDRDGSFDPVIGRKRRTGTSVRRDGIAAAARG
jgi:transposase-like protein